MVIKRGIDISSHQGNINLTTLQSQIDFVIIRVGYGTSGTIDDKFKRNADLCEELGIPYGFYWYSYALDVAGAKREAEYFLDAIAPYHPTMGCWFDMEDADGYKKRSGMPSNSTLQDMCYVFCEKVEDAGYYAGVYASQSWFNNQLAGDRLNRFDKWVAQWPTSNNKQKGLATDPESKKDVSLWQFTSVGRFSGYRGNLDVNYAYHDFNNPGTSEPTPEPVPEPITTPTGSTLELVTAVMQGEYGEGEDRKAKLGTRYEEVQDFINHVFTASADILVKEVIEGRYGNGTQRKTVLGARYNEVQDKVNKMMNQNQITRGSKVKFVGTKSYSGIQLASWVHNEVFNVLELSGDRVVIGKGSVVTAAVNIKDCKLV